MGKREPLETLPHGGSDLNLENTAAATTGRLTLFLNHLISSKLLSFEYEPR